MTWLVRSPRFRRSAARMIRRTSAAKARTSCGSMKHGFAVPDAWVLGTDAFAAALRELPPSCDPKQLLRAAGGRFAHERAAEAREAILKAPLPRGLRWSSTRSWRDESSRAPWGFAVRSSATCEDGVARVDGRPRARRCSACVGDEALASAIREVWASIASGRALGYLAAHGVRDVGDGRRDPAMVRAQAAGVMFTRCAIDDVLARASASSTRASASARPSSTASRRPTCSASTRTDGRRALDRDEERARLVVQKARLEQVAVERPDEARAFRRAHPRARGHRAAAREASRTSRGTSSSRATRRAHRGSCKRVPSRASAFPKAATRTRFGAASTSAKRCPASRRRSRGPSRARSAKTGFRKAFATLGCRVPKSARARRQRARPLLFEPHRVHAHRRAGAVARSANARRARRWLGRATRSPRRSSTSRTKASTRASRSRRRACFSSSSASTRTCANSKSEAERTLRAHQRARSRDPSGRRPRAQIPRRRKTLLERTGDVMLTCASSSLGTHIALKTLLVARRRRIDADRLAHASHGGIRDLESARPAIGVMRIVASRAARSRSARGARARGDDRLDALPDGPDAPRARELPRALRRSRRARSRSSRRRAGRKIRAPSSRCFASRSAAKRANARAALAHARSAGRRRDAARSSTRLNFVEQTALRHLVARAQKAARLRERMRTWVTRVLGMIRDVALDADRRLLRLVPGSPRRRTRSSPPERARSCRRSSSSPSTSSSPRCVTRAPISRRSFALRRAEHARDHRAPRSAASRSSARRHRSAAARRRATCFAGSPRRAASSKRACASSRSAEMSAFQPGEDPRRPTRPTSAGRRSS